MGSKHLTRVASELTLFTCYVKNEQNQKCLLFMSVCLFIIHL